MRGSLLGPWLVAHRRIVSVYCGVLLAWYVSVWLGAILSPPVWLHTGALFVHLASTVVGLGAALMAEYAGILWMLGLCPVARVREMERTVTVPAWLGILGLLGSGALLAPHEDQPLTVVKLLAVLVIALNGVGIVRLGAQLERLPAGSAYTGVPVQLKRWSLTTGIISQLAWWTAVVIGMLNASSRGGG